MDRSEQTKKNQAINLYTWGLELLSDGGHVRDADKVGWMLIENAATQGDRDAQNYLGDAYFYSYKKDEKAAFWYTKAAEQGLPEAQAMLGMLYLLGRGVTRNYAKAAITSNKPCRAANLTSKPPWPNIGWDRCIKKASAFRKTGKKAKN